MKLKKVEGSKWANVVKAVMNGKYYVSVAGSL